MARYANRVHIWPGTPTALNRDTAALRKIGMQANGGASMHARLYVCVTWMVLMKLIVHVFVHWHKQFDVVYSSHSSHYEIIYKDDLDCIKRMAQSSVPP